MSTLANEPAVVTGGADEFDTSQSFLKRVVGLQAFWILGVLIVICLFFTVLAGDRFLSTGNFSLISQNVAVWAVLGVGMTFVIITSGIDLSVGSVLVFSSVVSAKVMEALGGAGPGVAAAGLVVAVAGGMAWGVFNGVLVAMARVPPLIVTLGTLSIALGLAQVLTGGIDIRSVPSELTDFSAYTKVLGIPGLPFVALVVVILGGILLHKTRFGRYTYAIGSNEEAARRTGIKVTRHLVFVYALAGTLAGVGAILSLAQFGTTTIAGQSLTNLNVIAAVVIGGTSIFGGKGSYVQTVAGVLMLTVITSALVTVGVSEAERYMLYGGIILVMAYVTQVAVSRDGWESKSLHRRLRVFRGWLEPVRRR
jgi:ribose transport system permease protein